MTNAGKYISKINNQSNSDIRRWKLKAIKYVRSLPSSDRQFPSLTEIACAVGCTREFLRMEMLKDSDFKTQLKHRLGDTHGMIVDAAESLLYKKITINEDLDAAKFALDRLDDNYVKKAVNKNTNTNINVDISISERLAMAEAGLLDVSAQPLLIEN